MLLVRTHKVYLNLHLFHYVVVSYLTKYLGYKIVTQFNNTPLVEEQNNYATKFAHSCIVYDLDDWPNIPPRNLI